PPDHLDDSFAAERRRGGWQFSDSIDQSLRTLTGQISPKTGLTAIGFRKWPTSRYTRRWRSRPTGRDHFRKPPDRSTQFRTPSAGQGWGASAPAHHAISGTDARAVLLPRRRRLHRCVDGRNTARAGTLATGRKEARPVLRARIAAEDRRQRRSLSMAGRADGDGAQSGAGGAAARQRRVLSKPCRAARLDRSGHRRGDPPRWSRR